MRRSNILEITAGILVLVLVIFLLFFTIDKLLHVRGSYKNCNQIYGFFSNANGIKVGNNVKISGVDVGSITDISLDKTKYIARIDMCVSKDIKLPVDSTAIITSVGVIGDKFINISPGADSHFIIHGGKLEYTQSEATMGGIMEKIIGMFSK